MLRTPRLPDEKLLALLPAAPRALSAVEAVRVRECREPMVDLRQACPTVHLRTRARRFLARATVAERLRQAQSWLDLNRPGFQIEVLEAYRASGQAAAFSRWAGSQVPQQLGAVGGLMRQAIQQIPLAQTSPLATGGTLAVRLLDGAGRPLPMLDAWSWLKFDFGPASREVREHRSLLAEAMQQGGFANALPTWWHWSYGDRLWAWATGQIEAFFADIRRVRSA